MSESSKPTPGPWKVSEGDGWISVGTADDNAPLLADMIFKDDGTHEPGPRGREECRANARLMAASRDLLDACEEAEEVLATVCAEDSWRSADRALEAVRAAIKKAKGE
jgi:hypothetical protein